MIPFILLSVIHSLLHNPYLFNNQQTQQNYTSPTMDQQPPPSLQPATKKTNNKQQSYPAAINDLSKKITDSYLKLQNKYSQTSSKNETYLLTIYLKVLDKMLDQVVYAQEKVRLVDNENLKDEKCNNYLHGIAQYRDQCYDIKNKLDVNKELLKQEKKKTQEIFNQRNQLMDLCERKDGELELLKIFVKRQKQLNKLSTNKIIEEEIEKQEIQQLQNPLFATQVIKNKRQNKAQPKHTSQQKRNVLTKSKSFRGKKKSENEQQASHSISADLQEEQRKEKLKLKQNRPSRLKKLSFIDHLPVDRMNETLWLYQPSSYRKTKYLNPNIHHKNIQIQTQQLDRKLKKSVVSQDSTKKDSSVDQSHNISEKSWKNLHPNFQ